MAKTFKVPATTPNLKPADTASEGVEVKGKGKRKKPFRELKDSDLTEENGITPAILEGIRQGNLIAFWNTQNVTENAKGAARAEIGWFIGIKAVNGEGMLQGSNNKIDLAVRDADKLEKMTPEERAVAKLKGACDIWNYGMDLERRRMFRKGLMAKVEGPEKAVKKVVLGYLATEEYTHDEIREAVLGLKKFKGQAGIEKIVNAVLAQNA